MKEPKNTPNKYGVVAQHGMPAEQAALREQIMPQLSIYPFRCTNLGIGHGLLDLLDSKARVIFDKKLFEKISL